MTRDIVLLTCNHVIHD